MSKRVAALLLTGALLAGCTTAAQRQYQAIKSNNQSALQDLQTCAMAVYNSPEFAPLRRHVHFKPTDATLEQLTDANVATDEEIRVILEEHPKLQSCRQRTLDQISQTTPTAVPIFLAITTKSEDSLIDLIQKKQSWGAHVRRVRDVTIAGDAELQAEGQRVVAGLQQSHEAELARRQAAADAFVHYSQTQQIINNMNRPIITNCDRVAGMVNCVSQ
jgi:hypothetical protein